MEGTVDGGAADGGADDSSPPIPIERCKIPIVVIPNTTREEWTNAMYKALVWSSAELIGERRTDKEVEEMEGQWWEAVRCKDAVTVSNVE